MSVVVSVHLRDETAIRQTIHPDHNRVVLALSGSTGVQVDLFASRKNLVRLRDALTTALTDLDVQRITAPTDAQDSAA